MKKFLTGLMIALSIVSHSVQADSQVVYSCVDSTDVVGDSQVVYNLANFGLPEELHAQVNCMITRALVDNCLNVFEAGREIILKNIRFRKDGAQKSTNSGELVMDLEIRVEKLSRSNGNILKSIGTETIQIKFESEDKLKPTLENMKVVDISSSGVCK
ncbi:hypothetical protein HBN50_08720 [Halobacteriovorax sp. GB3]|uniref:hypothetical protein n=1 Tax=Halobacteriovorax sp. GB3 TaxID=2719615 RepID=UPI0023625A29|nr:hypothetical protein [Halobacteriovorax sp. GB3]MDD0853178.1 hypothetical protein [Halobacteriovorax sp. GB3]